MGNQKSVAFIGLGIMGKPMSKNLIKAGYALTVYDINEAAIAELEACGARRAEYPAAAVKDCGIVITMLPNSPHVKKVVMEEHGVIEGAAPGTIVIDMSSIAPLASQEIKEACAKRQIHMLDAPVSGGEPKAIEGTLSIMVGGEKQIFDQVKELLFCMGSSVVYCGGAGAGNTTKLANQIVVALNIAACSEAFTLAKAAGVDPQMVYKAIRTGLAGSTVMDAKVPMMIAGNDKPGFKIDLHIKDLNNAMDTGHGVGAPLPLTAQVMEMFQSLHADGKGQADHSALVQFYQKVSGISVDEKG